MKARRSGRLTSDPPTSAATPRHRLDRLSTVRDIAGYPQGRGGEHWHGRGTGKHGAPRSSVISAREDERTTMDHRQGTPLLALGLSLAALSFAPAAQEKKAVARPPLAEVRRDAARKQF